LLLPFSPGAGDKPTPADYVPAEWRRRRWSPRKDYQSQSKTTIVPPLLNLTQDLEILRDVGSTTETPKIQILRREASRDPKNSSVTDRMKIGMVPHILMACETLEFRLQITLWLSEMAGCAHSGVRDFVMDELEGLETVNNSLRLKKLVAKECSSIDTRTE
jgi:hypothetical protein